MVDTTIFECPFCGNKNKASECENLARAAVRTGSKFQSALTITHSYACVNPVCGEMTVEVSLFEKTYSQQKGDWVIGELLSRYRLRPEGIQRPQPDYIPKAIVEDYYEAGKILILSPKAAATLARRCLQGMIRDFSGISEGSLDTEIKKLTQSVLAGNAPKGVAPEHIEAIDSIRKIGNIGAHMEKDINLIIEIEPGEAEELLKLIEMLFEEWYVAREKRNTRLASIKGIADTKHAAKLPPPKGP